MAALKSSGATHVEQDLRRRNVPLGDANGKAQAPVRASVEVDDKKTRKVRQRDPPSLYKDAECSIATTILDMANARRMGVHYCAPHFHSSCLLYANMEDWSLECGDLGRSPVRHFYVQLMDLSVLTYTVLASSDPIT